ncbi:MAG: NAD(P)H-hydrate dehydratase [SAR324 cluster bacterium]|nr:NAD(P)H-hydrate dehydratase [SAR324 cluster bacterium]
MENLNSTQTLETFHDLERLCTSSEMQEMDGRAIEDIGIPGMVLMENAARSVADWLEEHYLSENSDAVVVVCSGKGNNGGDGYAIARMLKNRGFFVELIETGEPGTDDAKTNQVLWRHFGQSIVYPSGEASFLLEDADVIIDAIFGTGLQREIGGLYRDWIEEINQNTDAVKIGVDIPSGIHADHGQVMGIAVQCEHTITFQVGKQGCHQYPGTQYTGELVVVDISIPPYWGDQANPTYLVTRNFIQERLPGKNPAAHKGTYGHLLTICGSSGMGGAALLASYAAIKNGSGLVSACVPLSLRDAFLGQCPELMTLSPAAESHHHFTMAHTSFVEAEIKKRDAVVLGCGIGQTEETKKFVEYLVPSIYQPLLIDADGLNNITAEHLKLRSANEALGATVITPHPKELSRLSGLSTAEIQKNRIHVTRELACKWSVVLLLKGARTVIGDPEGRIFVIPTGNEGMATGGSGDVLSGIIGSFLAQEYDPLLAAVIGAYIHGLSGDCLQGALASCYLSALDLIHGLNDARLILDKDPE